MKFYVCKAAKLTGTSYAEIAPKARVITRAIENKNPRRKSHIRSPYFNNEKVFLDFFWPHINQSPPRQRQKRLVYLPCGIELVEKSRIAPTSKPNPNKKTEILHRFTGATKGNELFHVQIKEDTKTGHKYLMSIFSPAD